MRQSPKPLTLVEALSDIYEVVVLMTGRVGMNSTLQMFSGLEGRLILVAGEDNDLDAVATSREELLEAGFGSVEITALSPRVAA
jgi:polysaccharide biosynthesis transport protein